MTSTNSFMRVLNERFQAPRFGHSSTFSDLFSTNSEVAKNYLMGVFTVGMLLLGTFCLWLIALLLFKCRTSVTKRLGFLSGTPFQALRDDGTVNPWIVRGRIIIAMAGIFCITFGILLATAGIGNINTTSSIIGHGAEVGYTYFNKAQLALITANMKTAQVHELRLKALLELRLFLKAMATLTVKDVTLEEDAASLAQTMADLKDFARDQIADINTTLTGGQEAFQNIVSVTESFDISGLQWTVGITMSIIPAMLLVCLCWTIYEKNDHRMNTCRTWIIFPLFIMMITLSITFSSGLVIAGMMNSDFCAGEGPGYESHTELTGPDLTVLRIMSESGVNPEGIQFQVAAYIVSKCDVTSLVQENPLSEIEKLEEKIIETLDEIPTFINALKASNETQWIDYNVTVLEGALLDLDEPLKELRGLILDFIYSFTCEPLYAVYYEVAHQATCSEAYTGMYWTFMSLLLISLFGLVAITFRSALYPIAMDQAIDCNLELLEKQDQTTIAGEICGTDSAIVNDCEQGVSPGLEDHEEDSSTKLPNGQSQPPSFDDVANSTICTVDQVSGGQQASVVNV